MQDTREKWVDDVKVLACILVVLGHFFQSMIFAQILPEHPILTWFDNTIYYFHVPLFFLCSGYLYQKKTGKCWSLRENVVKRAVTLGIPYVVFSLVTWLLKEGFSDAVNRQDAALLETLLVSPASPYWYLYTLFFLFAVTPRFCSGKGAAVLAGCAVVLKLLQIYLPAQIGIYAISSLMDNGVWFVLGMLLHLAKTSGKEKKQLLAGILVFAGFLAASILVELTHISWKILPFVMGLWGCTGVVLMLRSWKMGKWLRRLWDFLAGYTMPVFVMHTIFAAGLRAVLLKVGIQMPAIHIVLGIAISFVGPVVAAIIMKKIKLDILLYPGKYFYKDKNKEQKHV